jgi:hypothetical protein
MATCEVSVALPEIEVFFPFALLLNLNCLPWQTTEFPGLISDKH